MSIVRILAFVTMCALPVVAVALAAVALIRTMARGPVRDGLDDQRVLLAFREAWDLSPIEIGQISRLAPGRMHHAIARLESLGLLDGYWQGGSGAPPPRKHRVTLTQQGRDRVLDLERSEIEDRRGE
jgi:hypothetical protein